MFYQHVETAIKCSEWKIRNCAF